MISCKKCKQVFKYSNAKNNLKEHYDNYHKKPKFNKDGTIQLNAVHQITLIIKRGKMWKTILRDRQKRNDEGGLISAKQLQNFEEKHSIRFTYRNEKLGFVAK